MAEGEGSQEGRLPDHEALAVGLQGLPGNGPQHAGGRPLLEALRTLPAPCPGAPSHRPRGAWPRPTRRWGLNGRYWSPDPADIIGETSSGHPACALRKCQSVFPQENTSGPWAWGSGSPALSSYREGTTPPPPPAIPQASQRERGPSACSPAGMGSPLSKDGAHPGRGQAHPGQGRQVSSRSPERALHWSEVTQRPARGHAGPQGPSPTGWRL